MRFTSRLGTLLFAVLFCTLAMTLLNSGLAGQDEGWRIIRADYGSKTQRVDVTSLTKDLIARGGNDGKVPINNITMGGDPAQGQDKWLRIVARNRRSDEREFTFKEHTYLEVRQFEVGRDDPDDRPAYYGGRDQDDWAELRIVRAYYGVQGKTVDVTDLLRDRVRGGTLSLVVTNSAMGGDPAIGSDKTLIVIYKVRGKETATFVREGNTLTIP
jgi:hypothetical protein